MKINFNKTIVVIKFCTISIFLICCKNQSYNIKQTKEDSPKIIINTDSTNKSKSQLIASSLSTLVLYNYVTPGGGNTNQLEQLLTPANCSKKFIFQFYMPPSNDNLTLAVWASKLKNQTCTTPIPPQFLTSLNDDILNIKNQEVYFSDQQLKFAAGQSGIPDNFLQKLKNNSKDSVFIFTPSMDGSHHIVYDIAAANLNDVKFYGDSLNLTGEHNKLVKTPLNVKTDPSPPAPAR